VASGPRQLSNLCPLIEDPRELNYVRVSYYKGTAGECASCRTRTYTNIEIARSARRSGEGGGGKRARGFSDARRERITARKSRKLYDLRKRESKRKMEQR